MRIAMIGAGYVGLVSGACFAEFGVEVTVMDVDPDKIAGLKAGRMPIYEPGLDKLVAENVRDGRLAFTTDIDAAVKGADAVFLAVGTPTRRGDGHADLSYVYAAAEQVARAADGPLVSGPMPRSRSRPTRNSCARAARSATSCAPTAS